MAQKEYLEPIFAQTRGIGNHFRRRLGSVEIADISTSILGKKRVEVVFGFDANDGTIFVSDTSTSPIPRYDIPATLLQRMVTIYDISEQKRTVTNVLRKGASVKIILLEENGDPTYKIRKPAGSFGSPVIGAQIEAATSNPSQTESGPPIESGLEDIEF